MTSPTSAWSFRALTAEDLPRLQEWLSRPHVARWWQSDGTLEGVTREFAELVEPSCATRGYIALLHGEPAAFAQCYQVMGADGGWWETETDPGARGIDLFIADARLLGRGLGAALIDAFAGEVFRDHSVTQIQADPAADNEHAIRAYLRAHFHDRGVVVTPDGPARLLVRPLSICT